MNAPLRYAFNRSVALAVTVTRLVVARAAWSQKVVTPSHMKPALRLRHLGGSDTVPEADLDSVGLPRAHQRRRPLDEPGARGETGQSVATDALTFA
jgi:hypothetical protein